MTTPFKQSDDLWNYEEPIAALPCMSSLARRIPAWIDQDISPSTVAAIIQGGCSSGAYMPAVIYGEARDTMHKYGDDVFEFLEENYGELPQPRSGESWSGIAVYYLSIAVELWASTFEDDLADAIEAACLCCKRKGTGSSGDRSCHRKNHD